jgi:tetratricopeptide (TPR) repeat protein
MTALAHGREATVGVLPGPAARPAPASRPIVAAVALLAMAIAVQVVRDRQYPDSNEGLDPFLYLQPGPMATRIVLSYAAVAADLDWIRAVQHFGGDRLTNRPKKYELLYPLLARTTTLDPRFSVAYRFGAIFLAEPYPGGAGRPDLAIALLKKGVAAQPEKWEYYQDIGFVYYWQIHDYKAAADWFHRGGSVPGGPWWLRTMAAVTLARGGDRATSRELWRQILQTADNDFLRDQAQLRLTQLDVMDQIDQLQAVVSRYRAATGRLPESWLALARAGMLMLRGQAPADPSGSPYRLDPETGQVSLAPTSRLHPLPTEPPGAAAER